jgi:hypothetical protein
MTTAAQFWIQLEAAEKARRDAVRIKASGNHLAAQNDEPEPTFRSIEALANEEARQIVRGVKS